MGSSNSRPAGGQTPFPVQQQPAYPPPGQQQAYAPPGVTNGQFYGGYPPAAPQQPRPYPFGATPPHAVPPQLMPPPQQQQQQQQQHRPQPTQYPGQYGQPPPRPVATHEYRQTQTIKNQVNLKRHTLKLLPLDDCPHLLGIQFAFDASAPCRVSTFVLTLEQPKAGCKITTGATAPAGRPVYYQRGLDQKFPPEGDAVAAGAHAVNTSVVRTDDLLQQYGDNFPVIIRMEALSEDAAAQGKSLEQLVPGDSLPTWVQAQTTYARLVKQDDGGWGLAVIKQKIWVKGVSYELQEIYGMEQNRVATGTPVADDPDGRECVICLSNERDTTVLPCRHMCMCQECASALKTQSNKCPVCRMEIESLLHIKIQRKPAAAAAVGGGGASSSSPPAPLAAVPAPAGEAAPSAAAALGSAVPPAYAQPAASSGVALV